MENTLQTPTPKPFSRINVAKSLQAGVLWVRTHQEQFWAITGTIVVAGVLIYFMLQRRQVQNDSAWTQLGAAQGLLMQGQSEQASKALTEWETRFSATSAAPYAKFLRADLLYNTTRYAEAAALYGNLAQSARPVELRPLALAAQSASEEMAGRLPEASAAAQLFLDKYPDHFLNASIYISQARLAELSGNTANAAAVYDRFVVLYPQSPWTAFARARLQVLTAANPAVKKP